LHLGDVPSIELGDVGAITSGPTGRMVDFIQTSGSMRETSGRAARASTTARPPVTVRRLTTKCERYDAPIRSSIATIGAWVRAANAVSVRKTNTPFASFVDSTVELLTSACDASVTRKLAVLPPAVSRRTVGDTFVEGPPDVGEAGAARERTRATASAIRANRRAGLAGMALLPVRSAYLTWPPPQPSPT
jgi:hypothetical protein